MRTGSTRDYIIIYDIVTLILWIMMHIYQPYIPVICLWTHTPTFGVGLHIINPLNIRSRQTPELSARVTLLH